MDEKDSKNIEHISQTLDQVLAVISKPESIFKRITDPLGVIITILGVIGVVEIIRTWFLGG